jgi:hypothetical protein
VVPERAAATWEALTDTLAQSVVADACPLESVPGEVDLAPIVGREPQVAIGQWVVAAPLEVVQAERIPCRLAIFAWSRLMNSLCSQ